MTLQTLTLHVPDVLYARLKDRADQASRTVEDETLDVLASVIPTAEDLPADLRHAVDSLASLADESLWRAARTQLSPNMASQIETLHHKRQQEGLSDAEARELSKLVREYERVMLVRGQAALLLKQRGHKVADLLAAP